MPAPRDQDVYRTLRRKLQVGDLRPGDRLSLRALARDMGVSTMPVRRALSRLADERLVACTPQVGHVVCGPDEGDLPELHDFRRLIEGFAAERCAKRITRRDLGELEDLVDGMRQIAQRARNHEQQDIEGHPLRSELCELDERFHHVLIRAAGNRWASRAAANLSLLSELFAHKTPRTDRTMRRHAAWMYREHRRIHRAIAAGKPSAARVLVQRHIGDGIAEAAQEGVAATSQPQTSSA